MKRIQALFLIFCLIASATATDAMETITLLTGEWSPYTTSLDDGKSPGTGGGYGLACEIVTAVLRGMQLEPTYEFQPWSRVLDLLRSGQYEFAFPYRKTPEREQEFLFSDTLITGNGVLFYNILSIPDSSSIKSITDLKKFSIGLVEGYRYEPELETTLPKIKHIKTELNAFEELVKGEIDLLPAEALVGQQILRRFFYSSQHKVARLPGLNYPSSLHLIAPKAEPDRTAFMRQFNESLKQIRSSGIHREFLSRYEVETQTAYKVKLTGWSTFPLAVGTLEKDAKEGFLIPRGTEAIVVEWHPLFLKESDFDIHKEMFEKSRVKILEGPLKDRLLWVPNMFLSFE